MSAVQQMFMGYGAAEAAAAPHYEALLYTGNATYPRTLATTVDAREGLIIGRQRNASVASQLLIPTNTAGTYNYKPINSATTPAASAVNVNDDNLELTANSGASALFNVSGGSQVIWLFGLRAGFLDVVKYTGNGGASQTINHSLGVAPGLIFIASQAVADNLPTGHRNMTDWTYFLQMANTDQETVSATVWNSTAPTSTQFTVGATPNSNARAYTAFLFGHDTSASGLVQCGKYTGNGSATGPSVNLGRDCDLVIIKRLTGGSSNWSIFDVARTPGFTGNDARITLNQAVAEDASAAWLSATGTGFQIATTSTQVNASGSDYAYIAVMPPV